MGGYMDGGSSGDDHPASESKVKLSDRGLGLILDTSATGSDYLCWWRANGAGYTYEVDKAGRYTRAEYERAVDEGNRSKHVLVPENEVEANTTRVVHYRVMRNGLKVLL